MDGLEAVRREELLSSHFETETGARGRSVGSDDSQLIIESVGASNIRIVWIRDTVVPAVSNPP
jgi:hypothetical protein